MTSRRAAGWIMASVGLLFPEDADAARRTEVAVIGLHIASMDDEGAIAAAEQLGEALEATEKIDVVPPGEVRGRISGREALIVEGAFLGPGRKDLSEGRVLYERADVESAIPVLERAVVQLQDGLAGTTESKDLIDALLLLGLAHASIGNVDEAKAAFQRVVVLEPTRELDAVNYPPKMVSLFGEVRAAVRAQPTATLVVQAPEDGADVFIDGRSVGKAPVTVNDLPPGAHFVLVRGQGGKRSFQRMELGQGAREVYQAPLEGRSFAEAAESSSERTRQVRQIYTSLGVHVATDIVILGGELPSGDVALQLYETRTGNFSQMLSAPAGKDPLSALTDLVPSVSSWLTEEGTLRTDRVSTSPAALRVNDNALLSSILLDPEPIVEQVFVTKGAPWYMWVGIAAIAGGGAATAAVLLNDDEPVDPNQGTIIIDLQ